MAQCVDKRQIKALNKVGTRTNMKCPNCEGRGQLRISHEPKWTGWILWCYTCGYKI